MATFKQTNEPIIVFIILLLINKTWDRLMREARIFPGTKKKNRKLPIIKDILTKKIGKMSLREGTSRRDEEIEVPSPK
jgi:hypothetical protein